jgi:hypothetical protein
VLGFAGPHELRVEVRIVLISLAAGVGVGIGCDEADGRIVHPLFVRVVVLLDRAFLALFPLSFGRRA